MNNPVRILQTLDRHLTAPAELTLFGRAALAKEKKVEPVTGDPEFKAMEALSKHRSQASLLPILHPMEERAGERRRVLLGNSPLLDPLPARSSRREDGAAQGFERTSMEKEIKIHWLK